VLAGFGMNDRRLGLGFSRWPVGPASRGGCTVEEAQQFHRDGHGDDAAVLLGGHLNDRL
jgi:hypothetical protein